MCLSVYLTVSTCVFVHEAVVVLLLCLVYIAVDFLCLCLRLCVCVCSCVHVYASVCFTVYVCASVVRICVCLPGRRLLRWAEDALRHPLAPLQLLQITIYQPLTFIFIFLHCLIVPCFCDFFVFVFVMVANCTLVCFFVFVKASVPMCHLLASKMGGHLDFKLLLHVVVLVQHLVGS